MNKEIVIKNISLFKRIMVMNFKVESINIQTFKKIIRGEPECHQKY